MNKKKVTSIQEISTAEAVQFLRDLAQALESGHLNLQDVDLDWERIRKLKLELKNIDGQIKLKTKVKPEQEAPGQKIREQKIAQAPSEKNLGSVQAKEGFKPLKKQMQKTWNRIEGQLQQNARPETSDVQTLDNQALKMLQYAGQDQELYRKFLGKTRELVQATKQDNSALIQTLIQDLKQTKKSCHGK